MNTIPSSRRSRAFLSCISAFAAVLMGCASQSAGPGQFARDWSCKLREMQVHPVFPPREDLQVGDIYWIQSVAKDDESAYCKDAKEFLPIPPLVAYLNVTPSIDAFYNSRPDFPQSSVVPGTVSMTASGMSITPGTISTSSDEGTDSVFTNGSAKRTRVVGFPEMLSVRVTAAGLGAIVPVQGFLASIGLAANDVRDATVSIPVAESYGIPTTDLFECLRADANVQARLRSFADGPAQDAKGEFQIINEVYYARAIDVTIISNQAAALGIGAGGSTAASSVPSVTFTTVVTGSTPNTPSTTQQLTQLSDAALKMLQGRDSIPGVTLSYSQLSSNTISMRRTFDHPVAIGFKSLKVVVPTRPRTPTPAADGSNSGTTPPNQIGQQLSDDGGTDGIRIALPSGGGTLAVRNNLDVASGPKSCSPPQAQGQSETQGFRLGLPSSRLR